MRFMRRFYAISMVAGRMPECTELAPDFDASINTQTDTKKRRLKLLKTKNLQRRTAEFFRPKL